MSLCDGNLNRYSKIVSRIKMRDWQMTSPLSKNIRKLCRHLKASRWEFKVSKWQIETCSCPLSCFFSSSSSRRRFPHRHHWGLRSLIKIWMLSRNRSQQWLETESKVCKHPQNAATLLGKSRHIQSIDGLVTFQHADWHCAFCKLPIGTEQIYWPNMEDLLEASQVNQKAQPMNLGKAAGAQRKLWNEFELISSLNICTCWHLWLY